MRAVEDAEADWHVPQRLPARTIEGLRARLAPSLPLLGTVFGLWLLTRLGFALVTYLSSSLVLSPLPPQFQPPGFTDRLLQWQRWDVNWYLIVSREGYRDSSVGNFFPLYPLSVGGLSWLFGDGSGPAFPAPDRLRLLVGMALSNLGLLVGLFGIGRLAQLDAGEDGHHAAGIAVRSALAFPFAIAWTVAYPEAFFLALAALTLLLARRGRWVGAAVAAGLAGLTRPFALVLVLPLLWEYGRQHGWWSRWRRPPPSQIIAAALLVGAAPGAMCLYFTYLWARFGDFLLPLHTQQRYYSHETLAQWQTFAIATTRLLTHHGSAMLLIEVLLFASFTIIVLARVRRAPVAYTLYMAGLLFMASVSPVPSQSDLLWGTGRYLAAAIPVYLALAAWASRRPWLDTLVFGTGMMVQGVMAIALFQGKPVL